VLVDVNILVSYLLPSRHPGAVEAVVEGALQHAFTLLLPPEVVEEFTNVVATKPYLAQRIRPEDAAGLMRALTLVAEAVPAISTETTIAVRDPKDDYLLAYAVVGQADYLVTGDRDLLALGEVEGVKIVTAMGFLEALGGPPPE